MKILTALLLSVLLFSCKTEEEKPLDLASFNLILDTERQIDSVRIVDIAQSAYNFFPYRDTIKVDFENGLNDMYNVWIYTPEGEIRKQYWFKGTEIIVKARLAEELEIDTVINSNLYYQHLQDSERLQALIEQKDTAAIEKFFLERIEANLDNPYSNVLAGMYTNQHQNDKEKIKELFELLKGQDSVAIDHWLSPLSRLENILSVSELDISKYSLQELGGQNTSLNFEANKTYLLDFWFMACKPCIRDHKKFDEDSSFLEANNVEFIGISIDSDYDAWNTFLEEKQYAWANYRQLEGEDSPTKDLAIWAFPTYVLLENGSEITARFNTYDDIKAHFEK